MGQLLCNNKAQDICTSFNTGTKPQAGRTVTLISAGIRVTVGTVPLNHQCFERVANKWWPGGGGGAVTPHHGRYMPLQSKKWGAPELARA